MKTSWLWENFWSQGKNARSAKLEFRELIEKLDEDDDLYRETKKKGEEIFGWAGLSKSKLLTIRSDIELLRLKIKTLFSHSHIREECREAWGYLWSQKVWMIINGFLPDLHREVNRGILLQDGNLNDLKYLRDTDWNPRRKKVAEEKLQHMGPNP